MTDTSTHLSLPYLLPAQAQKHVTHNEALALLDLIVQLAVQSDGQITPPATATNDDRFIVPVGAGGDWSGRDGQIAVWSNGVWTFIAPGAGWRAWVADTGATLTFDGTAWVASDVVLQNLPGIGVQTSSDAVNRLAVAGDATLLTHAGAGHQLKINKSGAGDTAAVLFQSGWSGRAEFGLAGEDAFSVKVSADGASWAQALRCDGATGVAAFGAAPRLASASTASLPDAVAYGAGALIFVTDALGGAGIACSDGTGWRMVRDDSAI